MVALEHGGTSCPAAHGTMMSVSGTSLGSRFQTQESRLPSQSLGGEFKIPSPPPCCLS